MRYVFGHTLLSQVRTRQPLRYPLPPPRRHWSNQIAPFGAVLLGHPRLDQLRGGVAHPGVETNKCPAIPAHVPVVLGLAQALTRRQ